MSTNHMRQLMSKNTCDFIFTFANIQKPCEYKAFTTVIPRQKSQSKISKGRKNLGTTKAFTTFGSSTTINFHL